MTETFAPETMGRGRGRPSKPTVSLYFRLTKAEVAVLDRWIATHADPKPTRQEAAQILIGKALGAMDDAGTGSPARR